MAISDVRVQSYSLPPPSKSVAHWPPSTPRPKPYRKELQMALSNVQIQAVVALAALGNTEQQIATTLGVEIGDVGSVLAGAVFSPPGVKPSAAAPPAVSTPTVVSGAAQQDATGLVSDLYVAITGHAAGTVAVAIGPDNTTADAIVPTSDATVNRTVHFRLPAGWWFKVTVGGSAAIASAKQVAGE